jgi:hypothetical protein
MVEFDKGALFHPFFLIFILMKPLRNGRKELIVILQ